MAFKPALPLLTAAVAAAFSLSACTEDEIAQYCAANPTDSRCGAVQPQPEPVVAGYPKIRPDFKDVAPSDWFYDWVYNAVDLGLVNGKGKDTDGRDYFAPTGNITFAETAKLAIEAGANVLVAGSAIFGSGDRKAAVAALRGIS